MRPVHFITTALYASVLALNLPAQAAIDHDQALAMARADFAQRAGCGGVDGVTETTHTWVIDAKIGYAGNQVEGYFIDKETGKITVPPVLIREDPEVARRAFEQYKRDIGYVDPVTEEPTADAGK